MILVRSPLRISLGGGGTDLPSYYRENEGFLIAAAINKYVFVSIMNPFKEGYTLKYSDYENVKTSKVSCLEDEDKDEDSLETNLQTNTFRGWGNTFYVN